MNKGISFLFSFLIACSEAVNNQNPCHSIEVPHLTKVADGTYFGSAVLQAFGGAQHAEEVSSLEIKDIQLTVTHKDSSGQPIQRVYKYLRSYKSAVAE